MTSLFISYCREDLDAVDRLLAELKAMSLPYWLDGQDIAPSTEFNARILEGLEQSAWFLIVMTPRSAASEYVKDELHWALTNRNGRIIPVMLEKCELADFHLRMLRIQHIDLTPKSKNGLAQFQKTLQLIKESDQDDTLPLSDKKIDEELESLSLLLTFITRNHQKHLRNLLPKSGADLKSYVGCGSLREELRDLCTWGLLKRRRNVRIADYAKDREEFNLRDVVLLAPLGRRLATYVS